MSRLLDNLAYLSSSGHIPNAPENVWTEMERTEQYLSQIGHSLEELLLWNLRARSLDWSGIRCVLLDVDGVMTEGGMYYAEDGSEYKRFDTKDGMAIKEAIKAGYKIGIISSGIHEGIIRKRAEVLGVSHAYVGLMPKVEVAENWLREWGLEWQNTAFIGDDINDLPAFSKCKISGCPSDAVASIKSACAFVLDTEGGHGCVREFMKYLPGMEFLG